MKYFVFFVLLNLFVCLAYSQKTCEKADACTPCQQELYKFKFVNENDIDEQLPEDKCLVGPTYVYHITQEKKSLPSADDKKTAIEYAINKTCAETQGCTGEYAKFAYIEIDTACSKEIIQGTKDGERAQQSITNYYLAAPLKGHIC